MQYSHWPYCQSLKYIQANNFEDFLINHADNRVAKGYTSYTIEKTYTILITVLKHYYDRRDEYGIEISDKFRNRGWKRGSPSKNKPNPIMPRQLQALYTGS